MRYLLASVCLVATSATAQEPPRVVADIAPVRALVAQIMAGVGTPDLVIPAGASPHSYAMRPSEARALREADLVVWVGPALTHWLEEPLDTLAGTAPRLTLMAVDGTRILPMRDAEELGQDGPDHTHETAHAHAHEGATDPHAWLDPQNAVVWGAAIAEHLAALDPAHADTYRQNLTGLRDEVTALTAEISGLLSGPQVPFVVLHDAFYYFEATFGVQAEAFLIGGEGGAPGPARVQALRAYLEAHPAVCAFTAPQENDALLRTVIEGQGTRIAVLDPMGDGQMPYTALLRQFAGDMAACLYGK
jgi:zinc transport system substrate-binding protein